MYSSSATNISVRNLLAMAWPTEDSDNLNSARLGYSQSLRHHGEAARQVRRRHRLQGMWRAMFAEPVQARGAHRSCPILQFTRWCSRAPAALGVSGLRGVGAGTGELADVPRTYSSWAHEHGIPGKVVAELMGHAK